MDEGGGIAHIQHPVPPQAVKRFWILDFGFWIDASLRFCRASRQDRERVEGSNEGIFPPMSGYLGCKAVGYGSQYSFLAPMNLPDLESKIQNSKFKIRTHPAFTLIELLTAMAVLAIILVMLVQVVNGILQSTNTQTRQMDSVGAARRMLDVIEIDISRAIVDENAAILVNADSAGIAFLADRRGPVGAMNQRFLSVSYQLTNDTQVSRSFGSVDFSDADLLDAATNTTGQSIVADGILGFQIRVLGDSTDVASTSATSPNWATNRYNGFLAPSGWNALITGSTAFATGLTNRAQSLQIWVAALDPQSLETVQLANVQSTLGPDPRLWRKEVDESALPPPVKSGIRVLTKTIPLP
jgi:prepilin-type N-terminal cleavage/methylation domain-containing protein